VQRGRIDISSAAVPPNDFPLGLQFGQHGPDCAPADLKFCGHLVFRQQSGTETEIHFLHQVQHLLSDPLPQTLLSALHLHGNPSPKVNPPEPHSDSWRMQIKKRRESEHGLISIARCL
jgi:hypothetical protein